MIKQFRRGYSNIVTLYGMITDVFKTTNNNISFGLAVCSKKDPFVSDYPKIIFYESKLNRISIDALAENFPPGTFVKAECHIQTIQDYGNKEKRIPYQSVVGDVIEKILPEYAPDEKNHVVVAGYVSNRRIPDKSNGMVRLSLHTKLYGHDAYIHALVYTQDPEDITDRIREKDFLYTIGAIQTRRVITNGRWSNYEDFVIEEIYRENPETHKLRLIYDHKKERKRERTDNTEKQDPEQILITVES